MAYTLKYIFLNFVINTLFHIVSRYLRYLYLGEGGIGRIFKTVTQVDNSRSRITHTLHHVLFSIVYHQSSTTDTVVFVRRYTSLSPKIECVFYLVLSPLSRDAHSFRQADLLHSAWRSLGAVSFSDYFSTTTSFQERPTPNVWSV